MPDDVASPSRRTKRRAERRFRRTRIGVAAGLALAVTGGTVAFATTGGDDAEGARTAAAALTHREPWLQASRSGTPRVPLDDRDAVTFTVVVDDESREVISTAPTIAAALTAEGIVVGDDDHVSVPMNSAPADGLVVEIVRVTHTTETFTEKIPFETVRKKTASLPTGAEELETEGRDGERSITATVSQLDGREVRRDVLSQVVAAEPVDEVVLIGTGPQQPAAPAARASSAEADSGEPVTPTYTGESPKAIGQRMVADRGWSQDQWVCLEQLWDRESGWNPSAHNSSSGAHGIPQALPGSKMASVAGDWRTNPATQIQWGLGYVEGRYGTACGAWSFFQSHNWY